MPNLSYTGFVITAGLGYQLFNGCKLCEFLHNLKSTQPLETQGTEVCVQHHLLWKILLTVLSVM